MVSNTPGMGVGAARPRRRAFLAPGVAHHAGFVGCVDRLLVCRFRLGVARRNERRRWGLRAQIAVSTSLLLVVMDMRCTARFVGGEQNGA